VSKRAEELATTVQRMVWGENQFGEAKASITAAIDAELRKERDRCAEQFRLVACPLIFNERTVKPESCQKCAKMLGSQYCTEVAAILKENP
jgi:hypothetical protein